MTPAVHIAVRDLTMQYGTAVVQRELRFDIGRGEIFVIMGGSGCGKSTLLRHLVGLQEPASGAIHYGGESLWDLDATARAALLRRCGVLYQSGALWSSMTVAENIALPLETYTARTASEIHALVEYKLAVVGLAGCGDYYPAQLSGGMRKRAGLARAMALDPDVLFFDEPSAGLDPPSAARLDQLILALRDSLGATVVLVTHELDSILAIGDNGVFLDAATRTQLAVGCPRELRERAEHATVRHFLERMPGITEDSG